MHRLESTPGVSLIPLSRLTDPDKVQDGPRRQTRVVGIRMRRRHFPYHLGIIIPVAIIIANGASAYYSVLKYDPEPLRRYFFLAYACVWFTYFLAIVVRPKYTDGKKFPGGNYVQCTKCNQPKPERAHHCRVCKRCCLKMDHHCPWTENCVGYSNVGYFLRFVGSATGLTGYCTYRGVKFILFIVHYRRHLSRVCPQKSRIILGIVCIIGNALICITLFALWMRVFIDTVRNQTQIEGWEIERAAVLAHKKMTPKRVFPFDVGFYNNVVQALGPLYLILWPFSGPTGSGHVFPKFIDDGTRWPPVDTQEVKEHDYYRVDRWISFEGDTLGDYGVDVNTEVVDSN